MSLIIWQCQSLERVPQTPSTGLRYPSFGGRCRKAMLGMCVYQRPFVAGVDSGRQRVSLHLLATSESGVPAGDRLLQVSIVAGIVYRYILLATSDPGVPAGDRLLQVSIVAGIVCRYTLLATSDPGVPAGDRLLQVSIVAGSVCRYIFWPRHSLEYLLVQEPYLANVLNIVLGRDITNKLYALNERVIHLIFSLFLSVSLCLCLSVCLSVSVSLCLCISQLLCLSLSLCLCLCVFLCLCLSVGLSVGLSLCLSVSLSLSLSVCLSVSISLSLSVSLSPYWLLERSIRT